MTLDPFAAFRAVVPGSIVVTTAFCLSAGCAGPKSGLSQGYVEAEFVQVSSALAGTVVSLHVKRGDRVKAGYPLFSLDSIPDKAARDEAKRRLAQGYSNWNDLKKSKRPSEILSAKEQLAQAVASLKLSEQNFARQQKMLSSSATSREDYDRANSQLALDRNRVSQLKADLETARLPARADQIEAAEANVRALESALAKAEWDLAQKNQTAPKDALVFDTLFREGEWVAAGKPVVALLPPANIKVRAYVPEAKIGAVRIGMTARVIVDGVADPFVGRVGFISPQAEYTPPVIYSRESRGKLVFLIEVRFDPEVAAELHPGQPVDVDLGF